MSAQFGRINFDGKPVDPKELDRVRPVLAPFGTDGEGYVCGDNFAILFRAFHTTEESRREEQPLSTNSGVVITWDGRLDNRDELLTQLNSSTLREAGDVEIVSAAYKRWGTDALAKLIGDWAVSILDVGRKILILAKDFMGLRPLFYYADQQQVIWSTIIDPLLAFAGHQLALNEEYIAGWFSFFPRPDLSPYIGIQSVPPCCFVSFTTATQTITKYWDFNPNRQIRFQSDGEYEEEFRRNFFQAVQRRLRASDPVLAELSGGMDSSSIVCVADCLSRSGQPGGPSLATVSFYNDSEPNWNERQYFSKVEEQRGSIGRHIDADERECFDLLVDSDHFTATPGSEGRRSRLSNEFAKCIADGGHRVILSGVGGDEVTGGVPTPIPELADLLVKLQWRDLAHRLKIWALFKRRPWTRLLLECAAEFTLPHITDALARKHPAPWLNRGFVQRNAAALSGYQTRLRFFGALPSFQENLSTVEALRRQLACEIPRSSPACEKRYPFLDRDFLEFLFAVPREQLIRPGQRRSLLRRALRNIVPVEILERRRKAFVARAPLAAIASEWSTLEPLTEQMIAAYLNIVDLPRFTDALNAARIGKAVPTLTLLRTIGIESWLRNLNKWNRDTVCGLAGTGTGWKVFRLQRLIAIATSIGRKRRQGVFLQAKRVRAQDFREIQSERIEG